MGATRLRSPGMGSAKLPARALSQRGSESMRGCFLLLLLHTCANIQGSALEYLLAQAAPDCSSGDFENVLSRPFNLTALSGTAGVVDLPDSSSSNSIGVSLPEPCPAFHCQRRSRKNRNKMICCLLTRRFKCPNSCD